MENNQIVSQILEQISEKYGNQRHTEYQKDKEKIESYLDILFNTLAHKYAFKKALAVGGTGIIILCENIKLFQNVIIKFNRPLPLDDKSMLEKEVNILSKLNNSNIIRILDMGEDTSISPKLTYLIEPYVSSSLPFYNFNKPNINENWLSTKLNEIEKKIPQETIDVIGSDQTGITAELFNLLLVDISYIFNEWVNVINYLHSTTSDNGQGYIYLDIKPENVLIDGNFHLTSIDYGSVEPIDKDDNSPVEVFFTERYAHGTLIKAKREKASSNRVKGGIKRKNLCFGFDYYALGSSMLEILNEIGKVRPHLVPQLPLYRSLHFLATRLLDAQNTSRKEDDPYEYAPQIFPGLNEKDYINLKYTNLKDVSRDLEKEQGRWNLEQRVPELATYSKDIVRITKGFNTVLTPRLRSIIEHPIFGRLKFVTQLGLVSLLYPSADHSRYDHALGSYTFTTNYIKSLFNDLGNPIFRNLVGTEDINAVLLASLLHDIGQYPLAHDLEEVNKNIFGHLKIGAFFLEDPLKDNYGRSLKDIIEEPKNGWGVPFELLKQILGAHSNNFDNLEPQSDISFKINVLSAIIDGPIDSDKADYIIRDSSRCELPYGNQLDIERLLRVLTVAIIPEEAKPIRRVTLGVYDKGIISAHAFSLARHQLLSTVYWHHTSRIIKAMLQYATALSLPKEVYGHDQNGETWEIKIREQLITFIKSLIPPFSIANSDYSNPKKDTLPKYDMSKVPTENVIKTISSKNNHYHNIETNKNDWYPGISWTDWLMLDWISNLPNSNEKSINFIYGIKTRNLYKRIATLVSGDAYDDVIEYLKGLDWQDKLNLCDYLNLIIYQKVERDWLSINTSTQINQNEFEQLYKSNLLIIIDIPLSSKKIGFDRPLGIVPELRGKTYLQDVRPAIEDKIWGNTMEEMIKSIAPIRILCHPTIRNIVSLSLAPIEKSIADLIRSYIRK